LWPQFLEYQQESLWLQWLVFIPVYGLTIFVLITHALTGS
jgi:hypothetical protein